MPRARARWRVARTGARGRTGQGRGGGADLKFRVAHLRGSRPAPSPSQSPLVNPRKKKQTLKMSDAESYSSDSSNGDPVETSWDDWTEDSAPATALFSADVFPSAQLALAHDKEAHGVDIVLLAATLGE